MKLYICALQIWCNDIMLFLNSIKGKDFVSRSRKATNIVYSYALNSTDITRSSVVRDLGVLVNSSMFSLLTLIKSTIIVYVCWAQSHVLHDNSICILIFFSYCSLVL